MTCPTVSRESCATSISFFKPVPNSLRSRRYISMTDSDFSPKVLIRLPMFFHAAVGLNGTFGESLEEAVLVSDPDGSGSSEKTVLKKFIEKWWKEEIGIREIEKSNEMVLVGINKFEEMDEDEDYEGPTAMIFTYV